MLGVSGKGNKSALAQQLYNSLGNKFSLPSITSVQTKVLSSWYLKPFKGSEATRIGIDNEKPIFEMLPSYLHQVSFCDCPHIRSLKISHLRDVGLVESKWHQRLASSVDQLCMIDIEWENGDQPYNGPAVCELKTKATDKTIEVGQIPC